MPWLEILIVAAVAAWLVAVLLWLHRRKKRGCSGCCESCAKLTQCKPNK